MSYENPFGTNIPEILVLTALTPKEDAGILFSPKLSAKLLEYAPFAPAMLNQLKNTDEGSIEHLKVSRILAEYRLLQTADKIQSTSGQESLEHSRRFNQLSEELYGPVDPGLMAQIAAKDLTWLEDVAPDSLFASICDAIANGRTHDEGAETDTSHVETIKELVLSRLSPVNDALDGMHEGPYDPQTLRDVFGEIIGLLGEEDQDWKQWSITNTEGKKSLSVTADKKEIEVPDDRLPVEDKDELLGLVLHEIGVHAVRAVNGYKTGDHLMATGLPNYIDFEEGLAVLFEYFGSGVLSDTIQDKYLDVGQDKYLDVGLATGAIEGIRLSREELIALDMSRRRAKASRDDQEFDEERAIKETKNHVNRIFRGGTGQPVRSKDGEIIEQTVFSKDKVYYEGYVKTLKYLTKHIKDGYLPGRLLDYLLSGKFDATNDIHNSYLKDRHSIVL